ncbi:hypothetical protein M1E17_18485 [Arthrobacter sp. D1-29]
MPADPPFEGITCQFALGEPLNATDKAGDGGAHLDVHGVTGQAGAMKS